MVLMMMMMMMMKRERGEDTGKQKILRIMLSMQTAGLVFGLGGWGLFCYLLAGVKVSEVLKFLQ